MELQVCSFWISAFSFAETSLYLREAGEREKESARGRWEGEEIKRGTHRGTSPFLIPRTLIIFNSFFIWIPAMAYLNKRGTSECFAPGVPPYKREKDVWLAKFVFYAGKWYQFMITRCSKLAVKKVNMD